MPHTHSAQTTGSELVKELAAEIKGQVIVVTGVTPNGLGAVFAEAVAHGQPALLILTARSPEKAEKTAEAIKATGVQTKVLQLDLGSLASVRKAADELNSWTDVPYIDLLVNNAGIMATDFKLSPDGFESQFATNHLGHFLFTNVIMNKLLASKSPRIVNVSSDGHRFSPIRWGDYNFMNGETYNKWRAYGQSKTANMLFSLSLAEKLGSTGLQSYSLHPGVILNTNLDTHIDWDQDGSTFQAVDREMGNKEGWAECKLKSADQGVATHVYAAFDPNLKEHNGTYLEDSHVADPWVETVKPWAASKIEAERLWKLSEKLVGQDFSY